MEGCSHPSSFQQSIVLSFFSLGSGHSDGDDVEESNSNIGFKHQDTPRRSFAQVQLEALENEFNKTNYHDVFSRDELANRIEYAEQIRSQVRTFLSFCNWNA